MSEFDVVIVGAGPVGLLLGCELGLAGCSVLVLERESAPHSPWRAEPLGNRGLFSTSIGAFDRRGLLPAVRKASGLPGGFDADEPSRVRFAGHFAGMGINPANIDFDALPYRLPSPAPDSMMSSLDAIETVLSERASELGVQVRYGVPVSGIAQHDRGVSVRSGDREFQARWAVGCDGGRSVVRKLAGFEFVGTEPQFTGYSVLASIAEPHELRSGFTLTPTGMYLLRPDGLISMMDFDGGAFDRARQPTLDELQTVLRRVSGTAVTLNEVHYASTFTDRAMQASTYRRERILLAGDAAHIHSPLGGQGLNTGVGDAMNLGWKLAATVRGDAPDGLLDTYTCERHPIGAHVLDWSRAQVTAMRPDPYGKAIQAVIRDLIATRDGSTYVFETIAGLSTRYDLDDAHPLIGRSAPDFRLDGGTRLADLMHHGLGVALDFCGDHQLESSVSHWRNRIRYTTARVRNDLGLAAVLIRPDGIVAWVGEGDIDPAAFERAATRWFGTAES
ncbi:FAD-dependent monooxygenase [Nocardia sp. NPDC052001]|uniref:FAD-dependent monooxygenase n=1 Tax=Nocardia sp. NPDC052001 TaxID=3154853 RepID=UPI00342E179F